MASEAELADLFVTLRAVNAPLLEGFTQSATAGEEMVAALNASFLEIDASIARTAESLAALRSEMAGVGASTVGIGAETATGAAGTGLAAGGEAETAAAANAAAADITAADDQIMADFARVAEQARISTAEVSASYAEMAGAVKASSAGMAEAEVAAGAANAKLGAAMDDSALQAKASAKSYGMVALGAAVVAGATVKMAADFETATNRLMTSAGETQQNIGMVRQGLLDMAGQVGVSADTLAKAMYTVESAGYHAGEGLGVLKAAEQGAKAEGADATTVADALSSAMRDYYPNAHGAAEVTRDATDVMSKFIGATSAGKMTFQDLASALHSVLPAASVAHVSLNDILGALAAMTVHGMSADQATQNLSHTIGHLQTVTAPQAKELALLGLNARQVADDLGTKGLTGTIQEIAGAIQKNMGPNSTHVVLELTTALRGLPPAVQALGQQAVDGTITMGAFTKATKALGVENAGTSSSFATLMKATHGIGQAQQTGAQVIQTYSQALKAATGDSTGLNVALMLSGQNADYTNQAVKQVTGSTADAAGNVKGWSDIQGTFNQKMSEAKAGLGALAISIGTRLLPVASAIATVFAAGATWMSQHQKVATALAVVLGGVLVIALAAVTVSMWGFTAALLANPMVWVVAGIMALIVAIVLLITHWKQVVTAVKAVWHDITSAFDGGVRAVGRFLGNLGGDVVNFFSRTLPSKLWGAISWVGDLGKNIVIGIWNGLVKMGQWLWDKIWGWIKSVIPGPIKMALGISSPSTVLAEEVGRHIPSGIAVGIVKYQQVVVDAATALGRRAVSASRAALAGIGGSSNSTLTMAGGVSSMAPLSGGEGFGGGQSVQVNVYLQPQGSIYAQSDLQRDIQQIVLRYTGRNNGPGWTPAFT
ncbi:MAG: phage tail tape measure protein [Candidatus Dormibacteria bacterium]